MSNGIGGQRSALLRVRRFGALGTVTILAMILAAGCSDSGDGDKHVGSAVAPPSQKPLVVDTTALPVALKDHEYSGEIAASGGTLPLRFELQSGTLPPGLAIDALSGLVSGRPAELGEFEFGVRVVDSSGATTTRRYSIVVSESTRDESVTSREIERTRSAGRTKSSLDIAGDIAGAEGDLSGILTAIAAMPEGSWRRVNLNAYSAVWTPDSLRPLLGWGNPSPASIILAWSGFAWDSKRAAIVLYGGGHANYRGNDVYLWRAGTQAWERGSLPSEMVQDSLGNWNAIDGSARAPASAHTYDNNIYLPVVDRMLVLGGAADPNGGHYMTQAGPTTSRITGPYFFDPSRADPNKVGGTTGSHVRRVAPFPEIIGGEMWSNREAWLNAGSLSTPPTESLVNGCTGYANENGSDVVYVRSVNRLYRYQVGSVQDPATDRWSLVGTFWYAGSGDKASCGYDPVRRVFVSTNTATKPFVAWNLATPGPGNKDIVFTPTDSAGEFAGLLSSGAVNLKDCGLEYDPGRRNFKLWCGGGAVWSLTPPSTIGADGWVIDKQLDGGGSVPTEDIGTGILGKWRYAENLDAFVGLLDPVAGNVWVYKPKGWVNPAGPGNLPPNVVLTAPTDGSSVFEGSNVLLSADALDGDGQVQRVEFFAGSTNLGQDLSAPYSLMWQNVPQGNWQLTARAFDNAGASRTSVPVTITVVRPANQPPVVQVVSPADGSTFTFGASIPLKAAASDANGSVATVAFFDGLNQIGQIASAPYDFAWSTASAGDHTITARAVDNQGAATVSAPIVVTVRADSTGGTRSVTIQRGLLAGAQVADTYLSVYHKPLNFGAATSFQDYLSDYTSLIRFAIFQSEGGPVPDGATIQSAVLSVYKYSSYNMTYSLHRVLVPWSENAASWTKTGIGSSNWSTAGAKGAGVDYRAASDASGSTAFDPGWVNFDVTSATREIRANTSGNFGWRLIGTAGYTTGLKRFYSSEFSTNDLRPKLVITYE